MSQTAYDISVIICAYTEDRWDDLVAAVESVRQQTVSPSEIIVVIDHNPGLLKRAQEHLPGVVIVENREARGASGSRNSGLVVAKGRIIGCLDDDAVATPDWLRLLCEGFTHPEVLGVGGSVLPWWMSKRPSWFPEEFEWVVGCTFRGMPQKVTKVPKLIAANMAIRREVFGALGGFRSEIGRRGRWPISAEETDLCVRAHHLWPQGEFIYQPHARVYQRVPDWRTSWHYFFSRCYAEGLSKAVVTRFVGAKDGLAAERAYMRRTLPEGIVRGLADAFLHHDLAGFARTWAIVAGLAVTIVGYMVESVFSQLVKARNLMDTETVLHVDFKMPHSSERDPNHMEMENL